jgi:predicted nucleic acid-binding protein
MITSETALLDTNVLVYAADETSPYYRASKNLRDSGLRGEISLCIFPQILSEFFAVITNPKRVSNPRTQEEAVAEMERYIRAKYLLKVFPGPDALDITLALLGRYAVTRHEIFDVQLVAAMLSNDLTRIYTFNRNHFSKFSEVETLEP